MVVIIFVKINLKTINMRKPFQVTKTNVYQDQLFIHINYKDKTGNSITVFNELPFNEYKVGDDVIIDTAIVGSFPQSAIFDEGVISKKGF
jgi:hypothetical protein